MNLLLRSALLATAGLLMAVPASAAGRCAQTRVDAPALDLEGITRVDIALGADELVLEPGDPRLEARHCASTVDRLARSELRVERRGTVLHISTNSAGPANFNWFRDSDYLRRELTLTLPGALPVGLALGAGDAAIRGLAEVTVDLGSGDIVLRQVGRVVADVGSGELRIEGVDAVSLDVGSGGITARDVRGDARIRSVGSGEVRLTGVRGDIRVDEVGSGNVDLADVDGDVIISDKDTLDDIDARAIRGRIIIGG